MVIMVELVTAVIIGNQSLSTDNCVSDNDGKKGCLLCNGGGNCVLRSRAVAPIITVGLVVLVRGDDGVDGSGYPACNRGAKHVTAVHYGPK